VGRQPVSEPRAACNARQTAQHQPENPDLAMPAKPEEQCKRSKKRDKESQAAVRTFFTG
jgi:hypothetical protein